MVKRKIEEFEIGNVIGQGTVGTIYRARDLTNNLDISLKILLPTVSREPLILARFERETLILEKLSHPGIVRYFGGGKSGEQLFFAMELLTGGSLKDELARGGPLTNVEAISCGIQICSALQHAHNHGVIHRDLKPSNLLFAEDGRIKLVDFGIARDTQSADITANGLTVGSYAYMSPEQIKGDRDITGKVDLYSLGCVMYEMLTGRTPYVGDNFAQLFEQHLRTSPKPVRQLAPLVPQDLDNLVLQLLAKEPEQRPFNARAVQAALMKLTDAEFGTENEQGDIPAANVVDRGRRTLVKRLRSHSQDVSWKALSLVTAVVITAVLVAWLLNT